MLTKNMKKFTLLVVLIFSTSLHSRGIFDDFDKRFKNMGKEINSNFNKVFGNSDHMTSSFQKNIKSIEIRLDKMSKNLTKRPCSVKG